MLNFLIGQKQIILASIVGGFFGGIFSVVVDTYFLDLYEGQNTYEQVIKNAITLGMIVSSILGLMSSIFAAFDYWLSFSPAPTYFRFVTNDSFLGEFILTFILGMSNTIIIICERAFSSRNSN